MNSTTISSDPRWTTDPHQLSLTSPWWIGGFVALVITVLVVRGRKGHQLRDLGLVIFAAAGWFVAIGLGALCMSVAFGWAAVTAPKQAKRGKAHRHHVFIWTSITVFSFLALGWAWVTGLVWVAVVTPVTAGVAVLFSWWWQRTHQPELDPVRLFSAGDRERRLEQQHGRCNYADEGCPCTTERGDLFEGDHIVPWAKGGRTVYDNLQMLCHTCNHLKTDLDDDMARKKCQNYWKDHKPAKAGWFRR